MSTNLRYFRTGLYLLAVAMISLLGSRPCFSQMPAQQQVDDVRVGPEQFAIFPWDHLTTTAQLTDAYDCGMNLAGFCNVDFLDQVQAAQLKCFVKDPLIAIRGGETLANEEITTRVEDIVRRSARHPAVFGYHLLDEPASTLFPVIKRWVDAFHALAPNAIAYTNLFPNYSKTPGLGGPFEDYITSFVETVKPKAFSYDHYALFETGRLRDAYFPNLEVARAVSMKTATPFWQVILANAHFNYAEPSDAWMRFQAYTSLAYGARGLGWFTFTSRERGNYRSSAIDAYGRRTRTFDMIRDANLQMHRLAPVICKMKSVAVYHTPAVPKWCRGVESSQYLNSVKGPGQYLIGEFDDSSTTRGVLVVNTSLTSSTSFEVIPKEKSTLSKVSSTTGLVLPFSAENNWLAPGQGMLLLLGKP